MQKIKDATTAEKAAILIIATVLVIGTVYFILNNQMLAWDFRNNVWAPAYLLVHNRSPYDLTVLYELGAAVWMPTSVGATFALGYLPEKIATNSWALLNVIAYSGVIAFSVSHKKPAPIWLGLGVFAALIFLPTITAIAIGQIGIINMLIWFLVVPLLVHDKVGLAAFLMALSTAKPQLLVLVGPAMLIVAYRTGGWHLLGRFIAYGLLWSFILTIPLWIGYPEWVGDFIESLQNNPTYQQPSSLYQLRLHLGSTPGIVGWLILLIGVSVIVMRHWWQSTQYRVSLIWTFALTPLVSPYTWTWDFVLLVPALLWTLYSLKSVFSKILLSIGYMVTFILSVHIRVATDNNEVRFWWMPWCLFILLAFVWWVDHRVMKRSYADTKRR